MKTTDLRTGGCLCGNVRYTVPSAPLATVICHCRHCQRQAGSAFSVVAVFARSEVRIEGALSTFEDRGTSGQKVYRQFCANCGSPVLTDTERAREQGLIFVGIDVIGDYLTEINVTSPTGLQEIERFDGTNIAAMIWDAIEGRLP